jgi:hypothetical protein
VLRLRLGWVHLDHWRILLTVSTVEAAVAAKELRRWIAWLGGSLVAASLFTALALAGLGPWLILPAILVGPGLGGIALIWLALTSDTNAVAHAISEPVVEAEAIAA